MTSFGHPCQGVYCLFFLSSRCPPRGPWIRALISCILVLTSLQRLYPAVGWALISLSFIYQIHFIIPKMVKAILGILYLSQLTILPKFCETFNLD